MNTNLLDHKDLTTIEAADGSKALVRKSEIERIQKEEAETEPVEYQLIFSKYPTLNSLACKYKRMVDYVAWQRDMLRIYTDSYLADVATLPQAEIYCSEHDFDMKNKGKGKLKAVFIIKKGREVLDKHRLVLNKVKAIDVHRIIDTHIYLLEMALHGKEEDYKNEEGPLHKFCKVINRPELLKTTVELIDAIKEMKTDGTIIEKKGEE